MAVGTCWDDYLKIDANGDGWLPPDRAGEAFSRFAPLALPAGREIGVFPGCGPTTAPSTGGDVLQLPDPDRLWLLGPPRRLPVQICNWPLADAVRGAFWIVRIARSRRFLLGEIADKLARRRDALTNLWDDLAEKAPPEAWDDWAFAAVMGGLRTAADGLSEATLAHLGRRRQRDEPGPTPLMQMDPGAVIKLKPETVAAAFLFRWGMGFPVAASLLVSWGVLDWKERPFENLAENLGRAANRAVVAEYANHLLALDWRGREAALPKPSDFLRYETSFDPLLTCGPIIIGLSQTIARMRGDSDLEDAINQVQYIGPTAALADPNVRSLLSNDEVQTLAPSGNDDGDGGDALANANADALMTVVGAVFHRVKGRAITLDDLEHSSGLVALPFGACARRYLERSGLGSGTLEDSDEERSVLVRMRARCGNGVAAVLARHLLLRLLLEVEADG